MSKNKNKKFSSPVLPEQLEDSPLPIESAPVVSTETSVEKSTETTTVTTEVVTSVTTEVVTETSADEAGSEMNQEPASTGTEVQEVVFAPRLRKYAAAHERTLNLMKAGAAYLGNPDWEYRNKMFTVGPSNKAKESSVMGKIRMFVAAHGPISGQDLVTRLFNEVDFQDRHRTDFVRGGKPTYKWIEDYVQGGLKKIHPYLSIYVPGAEKK